MTGALFHADAESKRANESAARRLVRRQRDSAPLLEKLRAWCEARRGNIERGDTNPLILPANISIDDPRLCVVRFARPAHQFRPAAGRGSAGQSRPRTSDWISG